MSPSGFAREVSGKDAVACLTPPFVGKTDCDNSKWAPTVEVPAKLPHICCQQLQADIGTGEAAQYWAYSLGRSGFFIAQVQCSPRSLAGWLAGWLAC